MAGVASRLLYTAVKYGQTASKGVSWLREVPGTLENGGGVANKAVTLAGSTGAATAIGGPLAGIVVGFSQLVTTNVNDYYRYRALEAQMALTRERLVLGFVEKVAYLLVTIVLAVLFRNALMSQVRRLDVNEIVRAVRRCKCGAHDTAREEEITEEMKSPRRIIRKRRVASARPSPNSDMEIVEEEEGDRSVRATIARIEARSARDCESGSEVESGGD